MMGQESLLIDSCRGDDCLQCFVAVRLIAAM